MKVSMSLTKLIVKLLILMILFVLIFMISALLYSARYWPDIYNYINANITIKRIPTISELELTIIEVGFTTENINLADSTTDSDYYDMSTVDDLDIDTFMAEELAPKRSKRNIEVEQMKDYIELPNRGIFVDYIFLEEPVTELINETKIIKHVIDDELRSRQNKDRIDSFLRSFGKETDIKDGSLDHTVSENPMYTKKYYTVQEIKRSIDEISTTNMPIINDLIKERNLEPITTKEGYLVGDEPRLVDEKPRMVDEDLKQVDITNETTEDVMVVDQNTQLMEDSVDVSNLNTRSSDEVEMVTQGFMKVYEKMSDTVCEDDPNCLYLKQSVYPWVATIFVTNSTENGQFNYHCDGILLSSKMIITAGRCVYTSNKTVDPQNLVIFLGKGNLHAFGGDEKIHRVDKIILHPNFTKEDDEATNDLALLILEEKVTLSESIQVACFHEKNEEDVMENGLDSATVAWALDGGLKPIFFNKERNNYCYDKSDDVFCATYGNEVPLCPNYGSLYTTKRDNKWCLHAIRYGDPAERGLCFTKNVHYTSLNNYTQWIHDNLDSN